ncbi:MAG: hypothetical protein LBD74_07845 [Spirochaetaceae bacterium]|nr:hypothetical protein [Spirochaetaceae bacterium]
MQDLQQALTTSEHGLQQLTSLYEQLSTQNDNLRTYNQQIAQRMQERDEDLAQAYSDLDRAKGRHQIMIALILILGAATAWLVYRLHP